jgi:hypothetical protein
LTDEEGCGVSAFSTESSLVPRDAPSKRERRERSA